MDVMKIIVSKHLLIQVYLFKADLCASQQPGTLVNIGVPAMNTKKTPVLYEAQISNGG